MVARLVRSNALVNTEKRVALVTFLFTDIEGSSRLWEQDPEGMRRALGRHDALSLLGLVRDAAGMREDAASCYRKALYLDPQHNEALVHLAYLLERQGETAAAARLRARGKRQTMPEIGP